MILDQKYDLLEKLGEGAFGAVWKAEHLLLKKRFAIKLLSDERARDPRFRETCIREGRVLTKLSHPGIVHATDVGLSREGQLYLVMELVEGRTLRQVLDVERPLPLDRALAIADEILRALEHAHAHGVVHRDLKPENVIVTGPAGAAPGVKVLDFGIAKILASEETTFAGRTMQGWGTPPYASPEQMARRTVGPPADVYAVGIMLYEMLSGAGWQELVAWTAQVPPEPLRKLRPQVSARLVEAVERAIRKDARERPATAEEFRHALEACATRPKPERTPAPRREGDGGSGVRATPVPLAVPAPSFLRRAWDRPAVRWGALGFLVLVAVAAGLALAPAAPTWALVVRADPPAGGTVDRRPDLPGYQAGTWVDVRATAAPGYRFAGWSDGRPDAAVAFQMPARPAELTARFERELPAGLTARGKNPQGRPELRHEKTGTILVALPPGEFGMGSPKGAADSDANEVPQHRVRLTRGFYLGKTDVTNRQFRQFQPQHHSGKDDQDDQPVTQVTWDDAAGFCAWAGLRLPTEAEWEYAARGGDGRRFPWGEAWPPPPGAGNFADESARHMDVTKVLTGYQDGYVRAAPVGRYLPNPFGLYDLAGNVYQWCADWYGNYPSEAPAQDPTGLPAGSHRVFRGGSYSDCYAAAQLTCANRQFQPPNRSFSNVGFRVALSDPASGETR